MITTRLEETVDARHDLLSVFHSTADVDVQNLKQGQLRTEAVSFFGGEIIASGFAGIFFHLSSNQQCYQKRAEKVRSTFNLGAEIARGARLSGCRNPSCVCRRIFALYPRNTDRADLEMSLVLAKALWYFDFRAAPSEQGSKKKIGRCV
ncbi:hypothetical protein GGR50DRAFT_649458 [Xylaria sp. CBS 124048]|nr:hypothetical protein GGR50DRAFT_649458 [Xylaria sp. CBS 124048]